MKNGEYIESVCVKIVSPGIVEVVADLILAE